MKCSSLQQSNQGPGRPGGASDTLVPTIDNANIVPQPLPSRASVVIIGGGIIGASAALFLSRAKVDVVLCEKGRIAGEQSGRNQGWVRATNRAAPEIPLAIEAMRYWGAINEFVQSDTGYRRCGILYYADTDEALVQREAWIAKSRDYQVDARMVTAGELERLAPGMSSYPKSALYAPYDGRAEPQKAGPAIAQAAQNAGAKLFEYCAVRDLDVAGGRIIGVITEKGPIACETVILAGGAWSSAFLRRGGIRLPQLKVRSSVMKIGGVDAGPDVTIQTSNYNLRKRIDGGYTVASSENHVADIVPDNLRYVREFAPILRRRWKTLPLRLGKLFLQELAYTQAAYSTRTTPFEKHRILNPNPTIAQSLRALSHIQKDFPAFQSARVEAQWAGMVDVTPDEIPVISGVDTLRGLIVATGFSGHGFGIGPAAGKLTADLALGRKPDVDEKPYRFARFARKQLEGYPEENR